MELDHVLRFGLALGNPRSREDESPHRRLATPFRQFLRPAGPALAQFVEQRRPTAILGKGGALWIEQDRFRHAEAAPLQRGAVVLQRDFDDVSDVFTVHADPAFCIIQGALQALLLLLEPRDATVALVAELAFGERRAG